jgi:hypothetical protein
LNGLTVTVTGIATVPTGVLHSPELLQAAARMKDIKQMTH